MTKRFSKRGCAQFRQVRSITWCGAAEGDLRIRVCHGGHRASGHCGWGSLALTLSPRRVVACAQMLVPHRSRTVACENVTSKSPWAEVRTAWVCSVLPSDTTTSISSRAAKPAPRMTMGAKPANRMAGSASAGAHAASTASAHNEIIDLMAVRSLSVVPSWAYHRALLGEQQHRSSSGGQVPLARRAVSPARDGVRIWRKR